MFYNQRVSLEGGPTLFAVIPMWNINVDDKSRRIVNLAILFRNRDVKSIRYIRAETLNIGISNGRRNIKWEIFTQHKNRLQIYEKVWHVTSGIL